MTIRSAATPELPARAAAGWALGISVAVLALGLGVITPALPLFGRHFGVGSALVGLLITAFGLGRLILNLPAGVLADRVGRRTVLLASPVIVALTAALAAVVQTFPQLVALRFLQGAGSALFTTAAMTAMADLGGPARRGRALSLFQGSMLVGAAIGPAVGGVVAAWWGFRAPFLAYALLALACAACVYLYVPELAADGGAGVEHLPRRDALRMLLHRDFILVIFVSFAVFFTRAGGRLTIMPLLAYDRLGASPAQVGGVLSLIAVINVLLLYPTGVLSDRIGRKPLIVPGLVMLAVALAMIGAAPSFLVFVLWSVLLGIGGGVGGPSPAAYMADIGPPGRMGMIIGLFRTAGDVGFFAGPLLLGWIADARGYQTAMYTNALLVAAAAVPFALWAREARRPTAPAAAAVAEGDVGEEGR